MYGCFYRHRWVGKWLPLAATITSITLSIIVLCGSCNLFYLSNGAYGWLVGISALLLCGGVGSYFWLLHPAPLARVNSPDAPPITFELPSDREQIEFDASATTVTGIYEFHELVQFVEEQSRGRLRYDESPLLTAALRVYRYFREYFIQSADTFNNYLLDTRMLFEEAERELEAEGKSLDFTDRNNLYAYIVFLNTL